MEVHGDGGTRVRARLPQRRRRPVPASSSSTNGALRAMSAPRRGLRPAAVPARPARRPEGHRGRGARRHRRLLGRHPGRPDARGRGAGARSTRASGATGYPATIGSARVPRGRGRRGSPAGSACTVDRRRGGRVHRHEGAGGVAARGALSLRDPSRDTVLYPAASYPTYEMGATLAGLRAVPVPLDDQWRLDLARVDRRRRRARARALAQRPVEPHRRHRHARRDGRRRSAWARERGIIVASDECYAEFTYDDDGRADHAGHRAHRRRSTACSRCTRSRSDRTWPGCAPGSSPATATSSRYLGEVRKHGGLMMPAPVQAAAAAALGDDEHVREQQARYAARRRGRARRRSRRAAWCTTAGRRPSTSGCAPRAGRATAGRSPPTSPKTGLLVAPGDFYGPAGATTPGSRSPSPTTQLALALRAPHRVKEIDRRGRPGRRPITALWEGRDDLDAVMPVADAQHAVHEAIDLLDTR